MRSAALTRRRSEATPWTSPSAINLPPSANASAGIPLPFAFWAGCSIITTSCFSFMSPGPSAPNGNGGKTTSRTQPFSWGSPCSRRASAASSSAAWPIGLADGAILAILTGLWLEPYIGWRWVFLMGAAPAILVVFLRRLVPESPLWLAQQGRGDRPTFTEQYTVLFRDHWRRTLQGLVLGGTK